MAAVTVATVSMKTNKIRRLIVFSILTFLATTINAAEVDGGITAGVSRTDNLFLATSPDEVDDLIYQVSPWIDVEYTSPGVDATLNYRYDWYRYTDLSTEQSFHVGRASVTGKAWQDTLRVELGASRDQVLSDPNQVIPPGRLPFSGNLTDRDEFWVAPQLQRQLGNVVSLFTSYRFSRGQYDDSDIQDDTNHEALFSVENYSAGQGLTWALRYNWRRTEYEISPPWENQRATAELGYWTNSSTRVFAAGGRESAWDDPFDPKLADPFWEAGFAHKAGESLSLEFAAGERSFGSSWRGEVDYSFRRGSTTLSYNETPTTTAFNRSNRVPGFADPGDLDDFLNRPGGAERFLSKRFDWALNLAFRRIDFDLRLFDEDRGERTDASGTPIDDESQSGASAALTWRAGARTEFAVSGSIIDQELDATNKSRFNSAGLSINYDLGTRLQLELLYDYAEQQPRGSDSTSQDYVANTVSLLLTYTL